jgi:hypothetical protein
VPSRQRKRGQIVSRIKRAEIHWDLEKRLLGKPGWFVRFEDLDEVIDYSSELQLLEFTAPNKEIVATAVSDIKLAGYVPARTIDVEIMPVPCHD